MLGKNITTLVYSLPNKSLCNGLRMESAKRLGTRKLWYNNTLTCKRMNGKKISPPFFHVLHIHEYNSKYRWAICMTVFECVLLVISVKVLYFLAR